MRTLRVLLGIAVCACVLAGCGYSLRSLLPSDYQHISVESFANAIDITQESEDLYRYRTFYPNIEIDLTREIIERFNVDGRLTVTPQGQAELVMSGKITDFIRQPLRVTDDDRAEEYRLVIVAEVALKDTRTNTYLWQESQLQGEATYFTGRTNEAQTVALAVKDLAKRIVERTIENW